MTTSDISLDKAELLATLFEGSLYGFSLPMFGGTIWALCFQRSTSQINRGLLTTACLLLLCSTVHLIICLIRTVEGLILSQHTSPGGPIGYFSDVSHWTFVSKNYVYAVQTLLGDGVVICRCYGVWRSRLVIILPVLLWCAVFITGFACPYTESRTTQKDVFDGSLSYWIISFWASTLSTNLLTTILLAYRIWDIDQKTTSSSGNGKAQLRPVLHIVIDAGIIYSVTLIAALSYFVNRSNGQYVVLDMITPIISITFYMIIIRVALATQANRTMSMLQTDMRPLSTVSVDRRSRSQVHSMSFVENSNTDNGQRSLMSPRVSMAVRLSEIKLEDVAEEV